MQHSDQMSEIKKRLEGKGHDVIEPEFGPNEKKIKMLEYFSKINSAKAILVCNFEKNGIEGYIGGNTLMEMGLALYTQKTIYLFNEPPQLSYTDEILGCGPIILYGDLEKIS